MPRNAETSHKLRLRIEPGRRYSLLELSDWDRLFRVERRRMSVTLEWCPNQDKESLGTLELSIDSPKQADVFLVSLEIPKTLILEE